MIRRPTIIATSVAVLLALMPAVPGHATLQIPGPNVAEQFLLAAANIDRAERGLPLLQYNATLAEAAREHALRMADHDDISHQFPGEPDLSERGSQAGVHFSVISENVAESPDASEIHDLWMHSEGHRENLLDPEVDSVGISVVFRNHEAFAVEDFANTVEPLNFSDQESTVAGLLAHTGLKIADDNSTTTDARKTCAMSTGYAGSRQPWFIMRYTADSLTQLPVELEDKLQSGRYHQAVVGACSDPSSTDPFTGYNIAILLYP